MNDMNERHETSLFIANGIVTDFVDWHNSYPTVQDVKGNFNFRDCSDVTDAEILQIIENVRRIDEREFLARHNYLRENKPNYYGFRKWGENGLRFVTNDDRCRKLATRLLS